MSIGIGEALREAREERSRTIADAAHALRVRTEYIEALEDEQFEVFGADTYARGHLRNYANYLGIDPQPLLDKYDRYVRREDTTAHQFADAPVAVVQREPLPRWVVGMGVVVLVVAAAALISTFGSRTPDPSAQPTIPTSPPPQETSTPPPPGRSSPTPTNSPTPTFEGVNLTLAFEERCWVRVWSDGAVIDEATYEAGEVRTYTGEDEVAVRFGAPGNVRVEHNGESLGFAGSPGNPITVTYGPDGPIEET